VVLRDQHANLSLRTQAAQRTAAAYAGQRSIVAGIKASGGTAVMQLVAPSAVAAHVSAAEVSRLRRDPAVAEIVRDVPLDMQQPGSGSATSPLTSAAAAPRRSTRAKAATCPFNPPGRPTRCKSLRRSPISMPLTAIPALPAWRTRSPPARA
jgi:hypothetical protein